MKLRILVIDEDQERRQAMQTVLHENGYEVTVLDGLPMDLDGSIASIRPDVIFMDVDSPERDSLEQLCATSRNHAHPVILFTEDGNTETIRQAVKAGVSAYVVGTVAANQIRPTIDLAIAQFEESRALREKLQQAEATLTERVTIERAKGALMRRNGWNEEEAHRNLRRMAMDQRLRLVDVAKSIVALAALEDKSNG